jgi:hypothetical protein
MCLTFSKPMAILLRNLCVDGASGALTSEAKRMFLRCSRQLICKIDRQRAIWQSADQRRVAFAAIFAPPHSNTACPAISPSYSKVDIDVSCVCVCVLRIFVYNFSYMYLFNINKVFHYYMDTL